MRPGHILLTGKQQLERVGVARRDALLRRGAKNVLQLPYKPHLRMHISKPHKAFEPTRCSVCIEWLRPLPDGRVRVEVLCSFWDFIPANGWKIVRDETSTEYTSRRARLFGRDLLPWRFDP